MVSFRFDEVSQYVNNNENKINFLKLQDDGWYAKVRFMYGPGEVFEGQAVHNVSGDSKKPKYVPCIRGLNQPLETCPLCASGSKLVAQYFIPIYVISIVSKIRGVEQEEPVNQVMLFQRGSTFKNTLQSIIRQCDGPAIVNTVFNLVRSGAAGDQSTVYSVEKVGTDNVGLESLPPKIEVLGSYILPNVDAKTMIEQYINKTPATAQQPMGIQPRTISANTFAGNTVVNGQAYAQPLNTNQAPIQAPNVPF